MKDSFEWVAVQGRLERKKDALLFKGGSSETLLFRPEAIQEEHKPKWAAAAIYLCNRTFSEGSVGVDVRFTKPGIHSAAELLLFYDPQTTAQLHAGLTYTNTFTIRYRDGERWLWQISNGTANALQGGKTYRLEASLRGSTVALKCDGVEILRDTMPYALPQSQVGVYACDFADIEFNNFRLDSVKPRAFVVMQFSAPYNEVYSEVIKKVCDEMDVEVTRGDEDFGTGLIIQDINRAIRESKIIIADISPVNANVFYEVGYAHALNKPTILLAEKGTKLPFDVSSFRTLFYENSIGGKRHFEEGLRRHIAASLEQKN